MKKMKKLLALLIVISIVSTSMGTAVFASSDLPAETQSDQKTESEDNLQNNANIDVEGTDSVGDILALAISEENEKSEERQKSVNSITGLDFSENNASVEYQTEEDAEIVVAVYDEQHSRMLASGNTDASKDGTVASVTITGDMPQYFVATAFLLDKESHEALCDSFTTEMYTKDIQDLKNSTTDNYDQDKVVQLEEGNKDTNFAVFNDETKVVTEDSEKNQIKDNGDRFGTFCFVDLFYKLCISCIPEPAQALSWVCNKRNPICYRTAHLFVQCRLYSCSTGIPYKNDLTVHHTDSRMSHLIGTDVLLQCTLCDHLANLAVAYRLVFLLIRRSSPAS